VGERVGAARPSMCLTWHLSPTGTKTVYRVCADGSRVPVFRGSTVEWLRGEAPEVLRDEGRRAEWPKPEAVPCPNTS